MNATRQSDEKPEIISETRAKQGFQGRHVLYILIGSLVLTVAAAVFLGLIEY